MYVGTLPSEERRYTPGKSNYFFYIQPSFQPSYTCPGVASLYAAPSKQWKVHIQ